LRDVDRPALFDLANGVEDFRRFLDELSPDDFLRDE